MPRGYSAHLGERRRRRNAPLRSRARASVTKVRRLSAAGDLDAADQAARDAVVALDKAAQKGTIHRNNAARRKSRIMKQVHRAKNRQAG